MTHVQVNTDDADRRRHAADELFDVCALLRATHGRVIEAHDGGEFTEDLQRLLRRAAQEVNAVALRLVE